jgi:hypothetical protein
MSRFFVKPVNPVLNRSSRLATGLQAFFPLHESSGDTLDIVRGFRLDRQNNALRGSSFHGNGAVRSTSNNHGFQAATPSSLRLGLPISIACVLSPRNASPDANSAIFGVSHSDADAPPFISYALGYQSGGVFRFSGNSGGNFFIVSSSSSAADFLNQNIVIVSTFTANNITIHINGVLSAEEPDSRVSPNYGDTSRVTFGIQPGTERNPQGWIEAGAIWNRRLSLSEIMQFSADPFDLCRSPARHFYALSYGASEPPASTFKPYFARRQAQTIGGF